MLMSGYDDLVGKVVLVTGASRGIGFAVSQALTEVGAIVIMASQTDKIFEAAKNISKKNLAIIAPHVVDVGEYAEVLKLVESSVKEFGKIDALINCAAIMGSTGPLEENDPLEWAKTINVNLIGAFNLMKAVIMQMKMQGFGSIVNFSGGGAASPSPNFSAYGCSKAAVVRLTETVAQELADTSIKVNVIAPGANDTDMYKIFVRAGGVARTVVTIDKPVTLALFLASNKSRGITGKFIHVFDDYLNFIPSEIGGELFTLRRVEP
jgi:NAD(P)-dependent dehydrogenase (short-subunit alcohol dehydrogenase family)